MTEKMKEETGFYNAKVIATGGMSELLMTEEEKLFDIVDRRLTLEGLRIIYNYNKS